jgi:hypothetical protein
MMSPPAAPARWPANEFAAIQLCESLIGTGCAAQIEPLKVVRARAAGIPVKMPFFIGGASGPVQPAGDYNLNSNFAQHV